MIAAARLAATTGRCDSTVVDHLIALLEKTGLPISANDLPATDKLMSIMQSDKKVKDGKVRLVLPNKLGEVSIVNDTPAGAVAEAWDSLRV